MRFSIYWVSIMILPETVPFREASIGDSVICIVAGLFPIAQVVTHVSPALLHCGDAKFDRITGKQVDLNEFFVLSFLL